MEGMRHTETENTTSEHMMKVCNQIIAMLHKQFKKASHNCTYTMEIA